MFDVINFDMYNNDLMLSMFDMYNNERSKFRPPNPRKIIPQSTPLKIDFTVKLRLFNRLFDYQPEASQELTDGLLENQLQNV